VISQGKVVALDRWGGKWNHLSITHRLTTIYAKNCCNRTLIVKVMIENVVTCFLGTQCSIASVNYSSNYRRRPIAITAGWSKRSINPLTPTVAMWVQPQSILPNRVKLSFLTSGLSDAQPWASECPNVKNYKWRLHPVWYRVFYSCTHMATVGIKGL